MRRSLTLASALVLALSGVAMGGLVFSENPKNPAQKPETIQQEAEPIELNEPLAAPNWEKVEAPKAPRRNTELTEVEVSAPVTETWTQPRAAPTTARDYASPRVRNPRRVYSPWRDRTLSAQVSEDYVTPQGKGPAQKKKPATKEDVAETPAAEPVAESATETSGEDDTVPSAAFPYTHLLPSPMNIPGGHWVVGSSVAFGVTDFLQLSTDVVRDVNRFWNISAKVPLVEFPTFVASANVTWETLNFRHIDPAANPDLRATSWQPGLVTGYEIADDMAFFVGGNFFITSTKIPETARTSGFSRGARLEVDWSYLYNPKTSRLADNAVSAGATYDITYDLWGVGLTHHWPAFELGFHYTVNADEDRLLPIVSFSTGFSF